MSNGTTILGFDYLAGKAVAWTMSEWRAKYPPAFYRREVQAGETHYHAPRHMVRGEWVEAKLAAEAYGIVPAGRTE